MSSSAIARASGNERERQDFKAQAEQVRSIAVERLGAVLGRAPADDMAHLDDALRLHLQL